MLNSHEQVFGAGEQRNPNFHDEIVPVGVGPLCGTPASTSSVFMLTVGSVWEFTAAAALVVGLNIAEMLGSMAIFCGLFNSL